MTATPNNPRFPAQPLIDAYASGELRTTARALGIDPAILCRPLTANQADAYATRLGFHPTEIWPSYWHDTNT